MLTPLSQPDPSFQQRAVDRTGIQRDQETLPESETWFFRCPDWALAECWWYEFKRESLDARRVILNWRLSCKKQTFDQFLQQALMMLMPPAIGRLYPLCPEWPKLRFSSIPEPELMRRFRLSFPNRTESLASHLVPVAPAPGGLPLVTVNLLRELAGWRKEQEEITLAIDWLRRSDKQLLASFAALLKIRRPCKARINVSNRSLRADLKALEAHRRMRANNGRYQPGVLYKDESKWILARKRVKRILEALDNGFA
jgi:hypothetical protein